MATIPADATNFWNQFVSAIHPLIPESERTDHPPTDVEKYFALNKRTVEKIFNPKDGNYQAKLSDQEMKAFNQGKPSWNFKKFLLAKLLWKSKFSRDCKIAGMTWKDLEVKLDEIFNPEKSDKQNWQSGLNFLLEVQKNSLSSEHNLAKIKALIQELAGHFIGKITHSSVRNGAIIALPDSNPLPYLYSGSIRLTEAELDRATGQNNYANTFKEIQSALQLVHEQNEQLPPFKQQIVKIFQQTLAELGTGENREINSFVDYRLKQLKIPHKDGYVVITPLGAAGLSKKITEISNHKNIIFGANITLDVGGSHLQNVSNFKEIKNAFVYTAPNAFPSPFVVAERVVHHGFKLIKDRRMNALITKYCLWLDRHFFVDDRCSYLAKKIEKNISPLREIVMAALEQYDKTSRDIKEYLNHFEDQKEADLFLEYLIGMGPIEQSLTGIQSPIGLADAFSKIVLKLFSDHKYQVGEKTASIVLSVKDKERLVSNLNRLLLEIRGWR